MENDTYNGWKNFKTWNIALWLGNDEFLYDVAINVASYSDFVQHLKEAFDMTKTPDSVSFSDPSLDFKALDQAIKELSE